MVSLILTGAGPFVVPVFKKLLASNLKIAAVVTQPDAARDRGKKIKAQEVGVLAEEAGIPVLKPQNINEIVDELKSYGADLMLTASYGQFVTRAAREAFPHKSYNLHPSLLPAYRGATPVNAALKDGLTTTGVTLYRMETKMDAGPLAAQVTSEISPEETAENLLLRLAEVAGDLAVSELPKIVSGETKLQEQDHNKASECHKMSKADAPIDWSLSANDIHNRIRAQTPWPGSYSTWNDKRLNIFSTEATPSEANVSAGTLIDVQKTHITVKCGEGALHIKELQAPGKKRLTLRDFLNGQKLETGQTFS